MSDQASVRRAGESKAKPRARKQGTADNVAQPVVHKIESLPHHYRHPEQEYGHSDSFLPCRRALSKEYGAERSRQQHRADDMTARETVAGQ